MRGGGRVREKEREREREREREIREWSRGTREGQVPGDGPTLGLNSGSQSF